MKSIHAAALLVSAALSAFGAVAQTAPSTSVPERTAPVVTDAAPPPAEDRGSTGAIELEQSPVKAKKEAQAEAGRVPTQIQGAGPLPAAVRDPARGTGLDETTAPRK